MMVMPGRRRGRPVAKDGIIDWNYTSIGDFRPYRREHLDLGTAALAPLR
jgi:hypothetical protein